MTETHPPPDIPPPTEQPAPPEDPKRGTPGKPKVRPKTNPPRRPRPSQPDPEEMSVVITDSNPVDGYGFASAVRSSLLLDLGGGGRTHQAGRGK